MLMLPQRACGIDAAMNLAAANQLFALISGISVLLYKADIEQFRRPKEAGKRFKGVIRDYMPFDHPDDVKPGRAADVMWRFARNPLAHAFGIGKADYISPGMPVREGQPRAVVFTKPEEPLTRDLTDDVLRGDERPAGFPATMTEHERIAKIFIPSLAWATVHAARALLRDQQSRRAAEELATHLRVTQ